MKLLIATPLYPPEIGGPATYARLLEEELPRHGITVELVKFSDVRHLPKGIAHIVYFLKLCRAARGTDMILALDPISVGFPVYCAALITRKPFVVRIGGDIVWERYVERTKQHVPLSQFYPRCGKHLSMKERLLFLLTKHFLCHAQRIFFSTEWQRALWEEPYALDQCRIRVLENCFPPLERSRAPEGVRRFLWAGRNIFLKNVRQLQEAFAIAAQHVPNIQLDIVTGLSPHELQQRIMATHVLVLPSLTDISPNTIIEGVSKGKPFILTKETGLTHQLEGMGIFVDPLDRMELVKAIEQLADDATYRGYEERIVRMYRARDAATYAREFIEELKTVS